MNFQRGTATDYVHGVIPTLNKAQVLNLLMTSGPLTISELVRKSSLSKLTVVKYLNELESEGLVIKNGVSRPASGRPAQLYAISSKGAYIVSVHFDFPLIRIALVNLYGQIKDKKSFAILNQGSIKDELTNLRNNFEELLKRNKVEVDKLLGIGAAIPGFFDAATGVSLHIPRISAWRNVDLSSFFGEFTSAPIRLIHDTNAMALAEQEYGEGWNVRNFAYVFAGDGVSAGIVKNGLVYEARNGHGGLLGHTTIDINGDRCSCGSNGCLEQYASTRAILESNTDQRELEVRQQAMEYVSAMINDYSNGLKKPTIERAVFALGVGIANMMNVVDLDKVIFGGYIKYGGEPIVNKLRAVIEDRIDPFIARQVEYALGTVDEAGLLGAAVPFIMSIREPLSLTNNSIESR